MNLLTIEKVTKSYTDKKLLDNVTLGINEGEKIGIIGVNGTGKTTLLKIIAGIVEPDLGEVKKGNNVTVAYLPQTPEFLEDEDILSYVIKGKKKSEEHWNLESEAKAILTRLGINDFKQRIFKLSGGQKKRVALARTLLAPADILVLDEPTNHIDNDLVIWLEQYLAKFKGVLVMVTHDRYFLDNVTNEIVEIDDGKLYRYEANYSKFLEMKEERENMMLASERKRQSILRNELEWIRRGARARSTKQKARIERYEDLKNIKNIREKDKLEMDSISTRLGKKTIEFENISKSYGDKVLIKDFNYIVLRNERIGIVGKNGCGKSTLMKILMGIVKPDTGKVIIGDTIKIGYFSQENEDMNKDLKVIDYIREVAEYIKTNTGEATASQMLEKFLFTPTMQWTKIEKLSGGERRRLYLLRVLMSSPNVLILDEPTNDLDIATLTILEDYLDNFDGIVITVSHDRYFLDRIVDRIFAFDGNGNIKQFEGGFSDYLLKSSQDLKEEKIVKEKKIYEKQRENKLKFTYMEKKEYETIDDDISKLEDKIEELENLISKNSTDFVKLNEFMQEKANLEKKLEEKMDRWVYLNDLAEKIENQ